MKTVLSIFQNVIVVLACIVLLAASACLVFGFRPAIVMSGSMEPEISTGSLCFYDTKAAYDEVRKGDIIAFKRVDINVTHRVTKVTDEGFVTKGDANDVEDKSTVNEYDYLGKTVLWIPELGKVAVFFKSVYGIVFMAIFVLLMIILSVFIKTEE